MDSRAETVCPICKAAADKSAPYFPFCSSRCQLLDLGNWLGERYAIPGDEAPAEEADADADAASDQPGSN